jgi:NADH:ubiquinone oxidoreductase subunit 6 (subunit J)
MENIKFLWQSVLEAQNFPAWELYVFFTLLLMISIIVRCARIEDKLKDNSKLLNELIEEIGKELF